MTKQETYIQFIVEELQKGNVNFSGVLLSFLSKFNTTEPTFAKYWKLAQERHNRTQQAINEQKAREYTQNELERHRGDIIDRNKFGEMIDNAFKLAYNNVVKTKGAKAELMAFMAVADRKARFEGFDKAQAVEIFTPTLEITDIRTIINATR